MKTPSPAEEDGPPRDQVPEAPGEQKQATEGDQIGVHHPGEARTGRSRDRCGSRAAPRSRRSRPRRSSACRCRAPPGRPSASGRLPRTARSRTALPRVPGSRDVPVPAGTGRAVTESAGFGCSRMFSSHGLDSCRLSSTDVRETAWRRGTHRSPGRSGMRCGFAARMLVMMAAHHDGACTRAAGTCQCPLFPGCGRTVTTTMDLPRDSPTACPAILLSAYPAQECTTILNRRTGGDHPGAADGGRRPRRVRPLRIHPGTTPVSPLRDRGPCSALCFSCRWNCHEVAVTTLIAPPAPRDSANRAELAPRQDAPPRRRQQHHLDGRGVRGVGDPHAGISCGLGLPPGRGRDLPHRARVVGRAATDHRDGDDADARRQPRVPSRGCTGRSRHRAVRGRDRQVHDLGQRLLLPAGRTPGLPRGAGDDLVRPAGQPHPRARLALRPCTRRWPSSAGRSTGC